MPSNETWPHIDYVIEPHKTGETPVTTTHPTQQAALDKLNNKLIEAARNKERIW
jgi:hypothetical protein